MNNERNVSVLVVASIGIVLVIAGFSFADLCEAMGAMDLTDARIVSGITGM
jgi:hypothetical protein